MGAGIMTAGGGHPWEPAVVTAVDAAAGPVTVIRRCADVADLMATAATGQAQACVVAADMRRLDTESVGALHAHGVAVVAVFPAGRADVAARMRRIGVMRTVADDSGADGILAAIHEALRREEADEDRRGPAVDDEEDPDTGPGAHPGSADGRHRRPQASASRDDGDRGTGNTDNRADHRASGVPAASQPGRRAADPAARAADSVQDDDRTGDPIPHGRREGTVIAVWGPGGAPGRTSTAMGIADQCVALGRSVLLIDADVYGGLLANAYGLLDESPGLAGVCRLATNGRLDTDQFLRLCWNLAEGFTLLTGIARADRWPEVRPSAIPVLLATARTLAEVIVVDCAALLEADEELSFDTMAPRRNGATLALVNEADDVVVVGSADPPGLERLVRGLAELDAVAGVVHPSVVLNRVRSTAAPTGELRAALRRFSHVEPVAFLPEDREAWDAAWRRGTRLSVAAPKSPLNAAYARLAEHLCPVPEAASR